MLYRKTSDSSRVPYKPGPGYRPGVQVNCTNRSRVPVTRRVPGTGRVRVPRVQAGSGCKPGVMVLAYLPQSATVDVCKHGIAKSSEMQIDMY